jgi:hypothetical protein
MTVERLLRDAADEVRATVVREATPPRLDQLHRGSPMWAKAVAAVVLVAGLAGLALVLVPTAATEPDDLAEHPGWSSDASVDPAVCADIRALMSALSDPLDEADRSLVTGRLDRLRDTAEHMADSAPSAELTRRFGRFVAIADLAVSAGTDAPADAAAERSWQVVALGEALLSGELLDICRLPDDVQIDQGG